MWPYTLLSDYGPPYHMQRDEQHDFKFGEPPGEQDSTAHHPGEEVAQPTKHIFSLSCNLFAFQAAGEAPWQPQAYAALTHLMAHFGHHCTWRCEDSTGKMLFVYDAIQNLGSARRQMVSPQIIAWTGLLTVCSKCVTYLTLQGLASICF